NHLGNVLATISDRRYGVSTDGSTVDHFAPVVLDANDYYPFGSLEPGRAYTATSIGAYRYGQNGQERDDEINGPGNSYTAEYWEYDPRVGRRWNRDPVIKYNEAPYSTFSNNPVLFADPSGADTITITRASWSARGRGGKQLGGVKSSVDVKVADGKDVFYYKKIHTDYDENGKATTTTSMQEFDPIAGATNGVTQTAYMFGLLTNDDNDRLTLAKIAPKELVKYLISKSSGWDKIAYEDVQSLQSDYPMYRGLENLQEATVEYYGVSVGLRAIASLRTITASDEILNFTNTAWQHMQNPDRKVPIQILKDVIENSPSFPDPRGSNARMFYERMFRNGQEYNLEVLYEESSNTIMHFKYSDKAMGPLPKIN
ncbi:RHS repeat-associated core domain-containing protein, partial [Dinghuibacter silviterrae]